MAEPVIDAEKQGKLDRFVFNALSGDNPGFESAKNWMKKGGRISAIVTDDSKYSANIFHHAVKNGWVAQVEWLVENGADINVLDQYGMTPIHYLPKVFRGTMEDWLKMAEAMLKDPKLNLNIQESKWQKTVFHLFPEATNQPLLASIQLARLLLSKKDDVNLAIKDIEGTTALTAAVRRKEKGLISAYEDYIAAHGGAAAKTDSGNNNNNNNNSGNNSSEEIKVMKELVLAMAEVLGDFSGNKRGGEIRELAYKLQNM